jgi:hypothetical protein
VDEEDPEPWLWGAVGNRAPLWGGSAEGGGMVLTECAARVVVWGRTGHKEIYWHRVPMSHTSQEELLLHSAPAVSS